MQWLLCTCQILGPNFHSSGRKHFQIDLHFYSISQGQILTTQAFNGLSIHLLFRSVTTLGPFQQRSQWDCLLLQSVISFSSWVVRNNCLGIKSFPFWNKEISTDFLESFVFSFSFVFWQRSSSEIKAVI